MEWASHISRKVSDLAQRPRVSRLALKVIGEAERTIDVSPVLAVKFFCAKDLGVGDPKAIPLDNQPCLKIPHKIFFVDRVTLLKGVSIQEDIL